ARPPGRSAAPRPPRRSTQAPESPADPCSNGIDRCPIGVGPRASRCCTGIMRIALVTGGNRGIGRAVVDGLTALGLAVLIGARTPPGQHQIQLDVTDADSVSQAADAVAHRFGRLDVLVNNAGISGGLDTQMPGAVDLDAVRKVFDTNVLGAIAMT